MIHQVAAEVSVSLRDATGSLGYLLANLAGATEIAAARSALAGLAGRLALVSGCAVVAYGITYRSHTTAPPAPTGAPLAGRALLVLQAAGAGQHGVLIVPGVRPELVAADGTIDASQLVIAELAAGLVAGPWCNPFGYELTTFDSVHYEFAP